MQCDRARHLVPQLLDGEAGPLRRWFVTRHLAQCAACSAQLEELQSMQAALRTNLPYHRASPRLAARIGAMLPREEMPGPARSLARRPVLAFTGTGLAGALAGVALTLLLVRGGAPNDAAVQAVIDSAIRSRMADHLTDVLTSDQHTVKPWLSARLNVSPSVPELKDARLSAGRRQAGLCGRASRRGGRISPRSARHQSVRVGVTRKAGHRIPYGIAPGLQCGELATGWAFILCRVGCRSRPARPVRKAGGGTIISRQVIHK